MLMIMTRNRKHRNGTNIKQEKKILKSADDLFCKLNILSPFSLSLPVSVYFQSKSSRFFFSVILCVLIFVCFSLLYEFGFLLVPQFYLLFSFIFHTFRHSLQFLGCAIDSKYTHTHTHTHTLFVK